MAYNFTERFFEEERIKLSNQLSEKIQVIEKEREQEKANLNEVIKTGYISAMASQFGIAKPEYTRFFSGNIQIENGKVTNSDNVVQQFAEFRKDRPELFNISAEDKIPVPTVDGCFNRSQVNIKPELTQEERLFESIKYDMKNNKAYQNLATTKL